MESVKAGRGLRSQSKEMLLNIYTYLAKNYEDPKLDRGEIVDEMMEATKLSRSTIYKVLKEGGIIKGKETEENQPCSSKVVSSPTKKKSHKKWVTNIDDFASEVIRRLVHNFHQTEGFHVSLRALTEKLNKEEILLGSRNSVRTVLRKLGFRWRKTEDNRKLLLESERIKNLRIKYLRKITKYRNEDKYIVYLDETYVHSSHTTSYQWSDLSSSGLKKPISKGQRLIIAHAGGEAGFINNGLLVFKSGTQSGDYHNDMNAENFENWISNQILPNLFENCVIIMDNASYHCTLQERIPTTSTKRADIQNWLREKNINFEEDMFKSELLAIVSRHKENYKCYKIDEKLKNFGHTVLRLPPYHPDLNPIEKIWGIVKTRTAKRNVTFKLSDVEDIIREEFSKITPDLWRSTCEHVVAAEKEYMEREMQFENLMENITLVIRLGDSSDESDIDDDAESD